VSVQTDRKKKELAPVVPPVGTAGGEAEGEDEREKYLISHLGRDASRN
jgi:hypothetical protein